MVHAGREHKRPPSRLSICRLYTVSTVLQFNVFFRFPVFRISYSLPGRNWFGLGTCVCVTASSTFIVAMHLLSMSL